MRSPFKAERVVEEEVNSKSCIASCVGTSDVAIGDWSDWYDTGGQDRVATSDCNTVMSLFKLWFGGEREKLQVAFLANVCCQDQSGCQPASRAPPATSLPATYPEHQNISTPVCNLSLSRFLGARPTTIQQKRPPCSTQSLSYQRPGLWLASGSPRTSSANFPRHISYSPTSRAVLVQLSIKGKLRWRCD
jgi:hypothetical protein